VGAPQRDQVGRDGEGARLVGGAMPEAAFLVFASLKMTM
jgi:hypothetical protein